MKFIIQVLDDVHGARNAFYRENLRTKEASEFFTNVRSNATRFNTEDRAKRFGREVLFLEEFSVQKA